MTKLFAHNQLIFDLFTERRHFIDYGLARRKAEDQETKVFPFDEPKLRHLRARLNSTRAIRECSSRNILIILVIRGAVYLRSEGNFFSTAT